MSTITSKLESILTRSLPSDSTGNEEDAERNAEDEAEDHSTTNLLHECPECSTVYLSEGARSCSACNLMTTPIETTD
jgi:hypothetical protein